MRVGRRLIKSLSQVSRLALVSSGCVLGLLVGALIAFSVKPLYSGEAAFKVGLVSLYPIDEIVSRKRIGPSLILERRVRYLEARQIERPETVRSELAAAFRVSSGRSGRLDPPFLYHTWSRDDGIVGIVARGPSPQETLRFLENILESVLDRHKELYQQQYEAIQLQYDGLVDSFSNRSDFPDQVFAQDVENAATITSSKVQNGIMRDRLSEIVRLHQIFGEALMPINLQKTRVVLEPTVDADPLKPVWSLYLIAGLFVGGVICFTVATISRMIVD